VQQINTFQPSLLSAALAYGSRNYPTDAAIVAARRKVGPDPVYGLALPLHQ